MQMDCLAMRGGVMKVGDLVTLKHWRDIGVILEINSHKNGAEVLVLFSNEVQCWLAQSELEVICK